MGKFPIGGLSSIKRVLYTTFIIIILQENKKTRIDHGTFNPLSKVPSRGCTPWPPVVFISEVFIFNSWTSIDHHFPWSNPSFFASTITISRGCFRCRCSRSAWVCAASPVDNSAASWAMWCDCRMEWDGCDGMGGMGWDGLMSSIVYSFVKLPII